MPKRCLNPDGAEKLINLVRQNSFVDDEENSSYMDTQKNYNFWESVAKAVNVKDILLTKQNNELILCRAYKCHYFGEVF